MTNDIKKHSTPKIGIAFILVIIMQYFVVPFFVYSAFVVDNNLSQKYTYFHTIISYTIIILSIIIFGDRGLDVFQDYFSLGIIALSCFLRASLGGSDEIIYKSILAFLGVLLTIYMIHHRQSIKLPRLKSVFIGLLCSIITVLVLSSIHLLLVSNPGTIPPDSILMQYIANMSIFHLSFITVIEEAYFRGLVVGFLVMDGYKEDFALFVQGILFWTIHYAKLNDPVLVFVLLPLFILVSALMIKKFRTLYTTIILHTLNNVFGGILVTVFSRWLSHL